MQTAYKEEIESCKLGLENAKSSLEMWYSQRHPEDSIVGPVKETLIYHADHINFLNFTIYFTVQKSIKQ